MSLPRGRLVRAGELSSADGAPHRADRLADAAALMMKAQARRADAEELATDRIVELSRLLAERLLGRSLELQPETIASLAEGVLLEARSARRVELFVNPASVPALEGATASFDPEGRVHAVSGDPALGAGDIRLETELGTVEARIDTELDRLAHRLREALRS